MGGHCRPELRGARCRVHSAGGVKEGALPRVRAGARASRRTGRHATQSARWDCPRQRHAPRIAGACSRRARLPLRSAPRTHAHLLDQRSDLLVPREWLPDVLEARRACGGAVRENVELLDAFAVRLQVTIPPAGMSMTARTGTRSRDSERSVFTTTRVRGGAIARAPPPAEAAAAADTRQRGRGHKKNGR